MFLLVGLCFHSFDKSKIRWYGLGHTSFTRIISAKPQTICIGILDKESWTRMLFQGYHFSKCNQSYFFTDRKIDFDLIRTRNSSSVILWIDTHLGEKREVLLKNVKENLNLRKSRLLFNDYGNIYHLEKINS